MESPGPRQAVRSLSADRPSIVFLSFDQALKLAGSFGYYQLGCVLVLQLTMLGLCPNSFILPYLTYGPRVTCLVNRTWLEFDNNSQREFCDIHDAGNCSQITWSSPFYSVVQQWGLVCSHSYAGTIINSLTLYGYMAAFVLGFCSDRFGRKVCFCCSYAALLLLGVGCSFVRKWQLFAVFRFVIGLLLGGCISVNLVWAMELTDRKYNLFMNAASLWHLAYMLTAIVARLTKHWRWFMLTMSCIGMPGLVAVCFCVDESPRWLVQSAQTDRAARLLNKIARRNRAQPTMEITAQNLRTVPRHELNLSLFAVFRDRVTLKYISLLGIITSAMASLEALFLMQLARIRFDPFLLYFIYGSTRLLPPVLIYFFERKAAWFGRRHMVLIPLLIILAFQAAAIAIRKMAPNSNVFLYLLCPGAIFHGFLLVGVLQFEMQLFPTFVRCTATSFKCLFEALGFLFVHHITSEIYFSDQILFSLIVTEVCGLLALLAGYFLLPESKGRPLPDTLVEVHNLSSEHAAVRNWEDSWIYWKRLCCYGENVEPVENLDDSTAEPVCHSL